MLLLESKRILQTKCSVTFKLCYYSAYLVLLKKDCDPRSEILTSTPKIWKFWFSSHLDCAKVFVTDLECLFRIK